MGNWQLEIARMAMYISFPVAIFHWFNQPENFEEYVIKVKQECYPPDNEEARKQFEQLIHEFNEKQDLKNLAAMEMAQKKFEKLANNR